MKIHITFSAMTSTYLCTKVILNFFEFLKYLGKCVHTKNLLCAAKCDILSRPIKFFSCASSSILSAQNERTWSLYSWNGEWVCLLVANECANHEKFLIGQYVGWDYWVYLCVEFQVDYSQTIILVGVGCSNPVIVVGSRRLLHDNAGE